MSESKFTKGPWEVEVVAINPLGLGLINEYQIVAQRPGANENFGDVIATVHTVDELDGDRANAYLIASSWELYAELKRILEVEMPRIDEACRLAGLHPFDLTRKGLVELIAKAEGRS
jgi:hypothetical protein